MENESDLRIKRGRQTRQRIVNAAFAVMTGDGPRNLSAGKITQKAEVSKASLFHHFNDVDEVAFAVLEDVFSQFTSSTVEVAHKTVADFVYQMGLGSIDAPPSGRKVSAAFLYFYERAAHDEAFRALVEKSVESLTNQVRHCFEQILKRPLRKREQNTVPMLVTMCLEGLGKFCIVIKDRGDLKVAWRSFADMIGEMFERNE